MRHHAAALLSAAAVTGMAWSGLTPAAAAAPAAGPTLRVGEVTLHACDATPAWCGSLTVAFDRADPSAGTIGIGFLWYAATGAPLGTIVAEEGGPGYPSSGTRDQYVPLFAPLMNHRNLLLVDNRGTGRSGAINCPGLQALGGGSATDSFNRAVAQCGELLNHSRRRADGTYVHGSDLYGTANAARDLADVLDALNIATVDLYGDSYGTWFSQTFASRYPGRLRSVTLDAAYEVLKLSPWYETTQTSARFAFDAVCRRTEPCRERLPGSAWARIGKLVEELRARPFTGTTIGVDGQVMRQRMDVNAVLHIVNDGGVDLGPYRELDAAAQAYLQRHDATPLLRLAQQSIATDNGASGTYKDFSDGLYFAVSCTDYPQLFDMRSTPTERRVQLAQSIAKLPADTFAPFTTREWLGLNPYMEPYEVCLDWPPPTHNDPPIVATPPLVPSSVPVLVFNGDLDSLTPAIGGRVVARQMGPSARHILTANTVHISALGDPYNCASAITRAFVLHPDLLKSLDASCAPRIPEVHAVADFPVTLSQATPIDPVAGNSCQGEFLRLAATAVAAAGDVIYRDHYVHGSGGTGLRGGTYTSDGAGTFHLDGVRWVQDAAVSGDVVAGSQPGPVTAQLRALDGDGTMVSFRVNWDNLRPAATAVISGAGRSCRLEAEVPAP